MVLQLCIFAVAAQEAKITIPAGLYTYGEIAQGLSGPGRTIKASSLVADRAAVVRLTDKSPAVALELVRKGLGVALARDGEDYQLVPDPEAEALDTRLFNQFCSTFDKHIQAVMNRAKAISGGAMPLTQEAVQALVKKHVQPDGDMAQLGVEPSKSIDKAALAMLAGASFQDPRVGASGPLYFYFANGGSVRKLIQGDTIETGDACYWRDNTRYPAWVRERAVATVRDAETAAALKFNDPGQAQQEVTRVARNTQITHRIYFDPRTAEIGFTYSILGPLNARTGWYGENKIAALRPPAMSSLPASIYDAVEGAGKHAARLAASSSGAEATNLYAIVSARKAASAAGSVLEWARKGSSDVICEISTVRDWNEVAASPRTTGPFGVWTISSADGVLLLRNEMRFLDRQYTAPFAALLPAMKGLDGAPRLQDYLEFARRLEPSRIGRVSRPFGTPLILSAGVVAPISASLLRLPEEQRTKMMENLAKGQRVTLELQKLGGNVRTALVDGLRKVHAMNWSLVAPLPFFRDVPLHPQFEEVMRNGVVGLSSSANADGSKWIHVDVAGASKDLQTGSPMMVPLLTFSFRASL